MNKVKKNPSSSLRRRYISSLALIALTGFLGLLVFDMSVSGNEGSGRVINIAGRQRMLSQKMTKEALLIDDCSDSTVIDKKGERLKETLDLFEKSHKALTERNGDMGVGGKNSREIDSLFLLLKPSYTSLTDSVRSLLSAASSPKPDSMKINLLQRQILRDQPEFLKYMDEITFRYDSEDHERMVRIKTLQLIIFGFLMLILLFVFLFIFFPFDRYLNEYFTKLDTSMMLLKEQATFDELTGTYNRKSGVILLGQVLERSRRAGKPLTVIFSDIDGLKNINDKYGHLEGDEFIKAYASIIKKNLRAYDFCIRYGGDEFITVASMPESAARNLMKRIENSIYEFNSFTNRTWKISHSYGVEEFSEKNDVNLEDLLSKADKKMYEAKRIKNLLKS